MRKWGLFRIKNSLLNLDISKRIQSLEMRCYRTHHRHLLWRPHQKWQFETLSNKKQAHWKMFLTTVNKTRLKWYGDIRRTNNPSFAIQDSTLDKRRRDRKKMIWKHHWVDRKILCRDSDIGMQPKHVDGAGKVPTCTVPLWSYSVMGLVNVKSNIFMYSYVYGHGFGDILWIITSLNFIRKLTFHMILRKKWLFIRKKQFKRQIKEDV